MQIYTARSSLHQEGHINEIINFLRENIEAIRKNEKNNIDKHKYKNIIIVNRKNKEDLDTISQELEKIETKLN